MPKVLRMLDKTDSYTIDRSPMWSLPMRLALVGRTGAGKTSVLGNLLLRPEMYRGCWKPENVFIFSSSLKEDQKLKTVVEQLEIPDSNLFPRYDENVLDAVYTELMDRHNEAIADGHKPDHSLVVIDDCSFSGRLAKNGAVDDPLLKVAMLGRKVLVSCICTSQKYSMISTGFREQLSGAMLASCSNKQLDLIATDHDFLPKRKEFEAMFRRQTAGPHDYFIIDYGDPCLYKDGDWSPLPDLLAHKR
jgi:hypothetical protein